MITMISARPRALALACSVLTLCLALLLPAAFAADGNAAGTWSGFYKNVAPSVGESAITAEISQSGDAYGVVVTSEEEGWTASSDQATLRNGLFRFSGPIAFDDPAARQVRAELLLEGIVHNGVWSGVLNLSMGGDTLLETTFSLNREDGGGRHAGAGGSDIWGRKTDATDRPAPPDGGKGEARDDPLLKGERPVWLQDPVMGLPFAMIVVPDGWMVTGRVQWNYLNRSNPAPAILIFTHPASGRSLGIAASLGSFTWSNDKERYIRIKDGSLMTDTGIFNLRYRNAEALLREFMAPLVTRAAPGAKIIHLRGVPQPSGDPSRTGAGQLAEAYRRAGRQVTGFEVTQAEMVVEYTDRDGVARYETIAVGVSAVSHPAVGGTIDWSWDTLAINSVPKGMSITDQEAIALVSRIRLNPQWEQKMGSWISELRRRGVETSIVEQRKATARMKESMDRYVMMSDRFRRAVIDRERLYFDPGSGEGVVVPESRYAVRDTINDRVFLSDHEMNPNTMGTGLVSLVPLE